MCGCQNANASAVSDGSAAQLPLGAILVAGLIGIAILGAMNGSKRKAKSRSSRY